MHAIYLPKQVLQGLDMLTNQTGKSKTYHVRRAISAYLEDKEDIRIATERLKSTQKRMSLEQVACLVEDAVES